MRAGPRQQLPRRHVIFLPHQEIAAEIGDQPLAVVDVGLIEAGAEAKRIRVDVDAGRFIIAAAICEGLAVAFSP